MARSELETKNILPKIKIGGVTYYAHYHTNSDIVFLTDENGQITEETLTVRLEDLYDLISGKASVIHDHNDTYVIKNGAITGATKTKITYDSKGLVTGGSNLTKADIPALLVLNDDTATAGKYISRIQIDTTDKHKLIITKADLPQGFSGNYNDLTNKPTLGTAASKNTGTTEGTVPILGTGGKLDISVLPATTITDTFVVASQAEMLALSGAQKGDIAVRTDLNKTFILKAEPYSTLANWQELLTPTDAVTSVNGKTGAVTLSKADVGLGNVDNTSDANKPISTATQTALNNKVDKNTAITGATKTKITYDSKGLVTGGADLVEDDIPSLSQSKIVNLTDDLASKVDKDGTKVLSDNNYTTTEKNKLSGIAAGAQVNVLEGVQQNGSNLAISSKKVNVFTFGKVTVSTAVVTVAKTGNITNNTSYTPKAGDLFEVTFTNGNSAAGVTLNLNSKGAKPVYLGGSAVTTANFTLPAGAKRLMYYDGTNYNVISLTDHYNHLSGKPSLNTTFTTELPTKASEEISGTITLHKIAKTGTYSDLLSKPILSTDNTNSLTTWASEEINGTISLHQISKTGRYSDLQSGVVALFAASGNIAGTYNSETGSFTIGGEGTWIQICYNEGLNTGESLPINVDTPGSLILLTKQTTPAENGLYRLESIGSTVIFYKVNNQDSVIIGYGKSAGRVFAKLFNGTWVASPKTTFATTDTAATDPLYEGDIVLIYS